MNTETQKPVTTKRMAIKALGMSSDQFTDLHFHAAGMGVDTWRYRLTTNVPGVGRRGDDQLFPVYHGKVAING